MEWKDVYDCVHKYLELEISFYIEMSEVVNSSAMILHTNKRNWAGTYIQQCIWLLKRQITVDTECAIVSVDIPSQARSASLYKSKTEGVYVRETDWETHRESEF